MKLKIWLLTAGLILSACSPAPIQPSANELALASSGSPQANENIEAAEAYNASLSAAASSHGRAETLSGTVWLHQTPAVPLAGVPLVLRKKFEEKWIEVAKLVSGTNGAFTLSPTLEAGNYWIGPHDKKYHGGKLFKLQPSERKHIDVWVEI